MSKALGVKLPARAEDLSTIEVPGATRALWLGPDEWLVIDEAGEIRWPTAAAWRRCIRRSAFRIATSRISVTGPVPRRRSMRGCPQDLSLAAFPVGACSRTILGKVEIVLLRTGEDVFRVECWRSFSDYVFTFLMEAARDAAA